MRILYGVQTTGHGHLVRSTPIIRGLRALGHEVRALLSGPRPDADWLARIGPPLDSRTGFSFAADGGQVRYLRSALQARPVRFLRDMYRERRDDFDLVITDFEPVSAWFARARGLRSVGIGHLYSFTWPEVPRARGNAITRAVLEHFAPATIPVGTHWSSFGVPVLPPTVDPDIRRLNRGPVDPDLVLVYLAYEPVEQLVRLLGQFPRTSFKVFARVEQEIEVQNVCVRPISRARFLQDLCRCSGVIANAGFTLTSECLHLGIPLLVKPISGQLEQESNAMALEQLGLAAVTRRLSVADLDAWIGVSAPRPQAYPDVTPALLSWLDTGAEDSLADLSTRLWQTG